MKKTELIALKRFSEYQVEHPLAHELPYWEFQDDCVVLSDGTLATGMALNGISVETLDAGQINQIAIHLRAFLNGLPDGIELSFNYEMLPDFRDLIESHRTLGLMNPRISWVTESRCFALEALAEKHAILRPRLHVIVYRRHEGLKERKLPTFFAPPSKFVDVTRDVHERSLQELRQTAQSISSLLETLGVRSIPMSQASSWAFAYAFLNPKRKLIQQAPVQSTECRTQEFTPEEITQVPALSIPTPREQLVFSDVILGYDSFYLDGLYHRTISLKALPEFTHAALISRLGHLPFPFSLHVLVQVPEQSKELQTLHAKRRVAHSMSLSHGGRATDLESEAKLHSTEELLRELINTGQKIFYFQLTILLRGKTKEELDLQTKTTLSRLRELNGAEAMAETVAGFKVFKTLLPFGNVAQVRPKRIKTENLADFLPVYQPHEGTSRPVCLFQNRSQGLVRHDPFDPSLPNYNSLVTGSSGAGKSFLNNLILLQYIAENPLVFVVDIGGSYRKLCEFMKGQYIEIAPPDEGKAGGALNPFALPKGITRPSPRKIKFLLAFLEIILTDNEGEKLHKLEKSLLEEAIIRTYQLKGAGENPTLTDFVNVLQSSTDAPLQSFSRMLYPWTGDRPYGRLLDTNNALDVTNDFVVFDLKGLSSYPDLQAVMILIMTDFILSRVDEAKTQKKRLIMDECWELIKHPAASQVMEYCVRTLRKTGSGITFITQGLEEIVTSSIGPAILSNTATKFILMQRGDLDPIRKILKLNEQEMALIASLKQAKGRYSESFVISNEARFVIRALPTPIEYWIATSDAADNQLLESERAKSPHKDLSTIIRELAVTHPCGAAGGSK